MRFSKPICLRIVNFTTKLVTILGAAIGCGRNRQGGVRDYYDSKKAPQSVCAATDPPSISKAAFHQQACTRVVLGRTA